MNIVHPSSTVSDVELTATIPIEMINAQQQLITWCDSKLKGLKFESNELKDATEHAQKSKWKFSTLRSQYNKSVKRIEYYEKIKAALLEGYYIIPNFPIDMFAIRTKKQKPSREYSPSNWDGHVQNEQQLAIGVADYKNPHPIVYEHSKTNEKGEQKKYYWAERWDSFEFPITMARPQIMEATTQAMALKIFDRIGIMPQRKDKDPVIIGQIIHRSGYSEKVVSFMIAWHLNTNIL